MKILFQYFYGSGGAMASLIKLLTVYSETFPKHEFFIVCHPKSKLTELQNLKNIKVIKYGGGYIKELERLKLGFFDLNKIAAAVQADVVWSLNLGVYTKAKIPQVLSLNNAFQIYPNDVIKYHPGNSLKVKLIRYFFKKSLKQSKVVILQTRLMEQYISKISQIDTKVVPKAVERGDNVVSEIEIIENLKLLKEKNNVFCIYIATRQLHKNHNVLFEAFKLLKETNINLLVSLSKEDLLEMGVEEDLIKSSKIIPLGWIKQKELFSYYNIANISLMPSKLESLSSSHIESMKWKKPLISSDMAFAKDLCEQASLYVDPDNAENWAEAIKQLINSPLKQQELINLGFNQMNNFPSTWKEVVVKIDGILSEIKANNEHKKTN